MGVGELLTSAIPEWLLPAIKRRYVWARAHLLQRKPPPLDPEEARQCALACLGGCIMDAHAFKNIDGTVFIAAFHRTANDAASAGVSVLRKVGNTFQVIFHKNCGFSRCAPLLRLTDLDTDGLREVSWEGRDVGTGAAARRLCVYMTSTGEYYEIVESRNHQAPAEPVAWKVQIAPEPKGAARATIERLALDRGFLQEIRIDPNDAAYAVALWHSDNGTRKSGSIKLRYYPGRPLDESTETASLETEYMSWIAKFKGALYGYDRRTDSHFVAYSPAWSYDWVDYLTGDEVLWFCDRNRSGLFRFELSQDNHHSEARLSYYDRYCGKPLPHISKLVVGDGILIINDDVIIDPAQLSEDRSFPRKTRASIDSGPT